MKVFLWMGCLSYFLIGLAHVVIGSLLPDMLAFYGKDYTAGGQLISLQFVGFLIGVLSGPWWSTKLGKRGALLLSLCFLSAAELVFAMLPAWGVVLVVAPFAGFGFGMIETVIGALIMQAAEEDRKAAMMARVEVFFGVGALVMPLLASMFIAEGWWRGAFLTLGLFTVCMLLLWWFLPLGGLRERMQRGYEPTAVIEKVRKGSMGVFVLFILIFLLYVGGEMSLANFLPSIFVENLGASSEIGALSVTCFWGAMAIGRLFAAAFSRKIGYSRYLLFGSAGFCVLVAGLALTTGIVSAFGIIILLGLAMSGMFAIALVYANSFFPGAEERTTSVLIAAGGIGGATLPLLTGWCMDKLSVSWSLWVLVGFALLMLLFVWATSRMHRKALNAVTS
ncbi:MFS transporter [Paenibacillus radicis (ex Xue et al. 2023)]|uniref:MFS transporter n=1 Tax=Paenibacillus radicis (ex Xue et al. 2023) TaxID=2972489 RepID=A0ABT1YRL4_9BACL|nr:MFS transporter [Paenibacillus radicis (ex Xue et al. 2023)]MCR8635024.1 MFS transporter [Paenibacillus radicis (ex Xue et al. 2023)]